MHKTNALIRLILETPLTITEWRRQRQVYLNPGRRTYLEIGFAAFYLNRCNRSGIIKNGGPIGGIKQSGQWKLDARFNREGLVARVKELSSYGDRILATRRDACDLLRNIRSVVGSERCFVYADPPYYDKGRELYLNHYIDKDHQLLAKILQVNCRCPWVATYDDVPRIRALYENSQCVSFGLRYSAHRTSTSGAELFIAPADIKIPTAAVAAIGKNAREIAVAA